jgi:hypothetical protein
LLAERLFHGATCLPGSDSLGDSPRALSLGGSTDSLCNSPRVVRYMPIKLMATSMHAPVNEESLDSRPNVTDGRVVADTSQDGSFCICVDTTRIGTNECR